MNSPSTSTLLGPSPFGYLFDGHGEPEPPPEAPGQPILSDHETNFNQQFLEACSNDQNFSSNSELYFESLFNNTTIPLPNFHSASSSYGHPTLFSNHETPNLYDTVSFGQQALGFDPQSASRSTLEAGSTSLHSHGGLPGDFDLFGQPNIRPYRQYSNSAPHNDFYQLPQTHSSRTNWEMEPTNIPLGLQYDDGNMRDIPPGIPESSRPRAQNPGTNESMSTMKRQALGFGSDTSFQSHHFAPPPGSEDPKAVEGRIMKTLDQLENSGSAENTQPSSPILEKSRRDFRGPNTSSRNLELDNITGPNGEGTELVSPTEKRRRKAKDEDLDSDSGDDDDDVEDLHRPAKKSKPNVKERTSIDSSKGNRRKSQSSDQKPARQNLTEGEKKLNHIKSEQKRRNQIKEGFSNLTTLMPDGVSASASKCAILTKAVQWMDELIAGNKKLKAQLDSMQ